jgi:hypothetical protein
MPILHHLPSNLDAWIIIEDGPDEIRQLYSAVISWLTEILMDFVFWKRSDTYDETHNEYDEILLYLRGITKRLCYDSCCEIISMYDLTHLHTM